MPYLILSFPKSAAAQLNPLMFAGIGGLAGGALGGLTSAGVPERDGEDAGSRRKRIIRDALLSAAAGAGIGGLGAYGVNQLNTARPLDDSSAMSKLTSGWKMPAALAGVGVGVGATASVKSVGANQGALAKALGLGNTAADFKLGAKTPAEVEAIYKTLEGGKGSAWGAVSKLHNAGTPVGAHRLVNNLLQKLSGKPGWGPKGLRAGLQLARPTLGAVEQGAFHLGSGKAVLGGIAAGAIPLAINAFSNKD